MKPCTITFRPQAREDVIEIAAYLRSENPSIADAFQEAVETACGLLSRLPEIGSAREFGDPRLSGLRMWPVKHFERYLIYGRLPVAKDDLGVLGQMSCSFISGLLCRRMPAGPDGIR